MANKWKDIKHKKDYKPVCMCGELIENHTGYEGHMAVDMHEYWADRKEFEKEEIKAWDTWLEKQNK